MLVFLKIKYFTFRFVTCLTLISDQNCSVYGNKNISGWVPLNKIIRRCKWVNIIEYRDLILAIQYPLFWFLKISDLAIRNGHTLFSWWFLLKIQYNYQKQYIYLQLSISNNMTWGWDTILAVTISKKVSRLQLPLSHLSLFWSLSLLIYLVYEDFHIMQGDTLRHYQL